MKTYQDYMSDLKALDGVFGFDPSQVSQTSEEWHKMRLGVITASKAECLISKKRGTKGTMYGIDYVPALASDSKRHSYMMELVSSIAVPVVHDDINARPLMWGRDNEKEARETYEAATFSTIKELPFIYKDQYMRAGISVDGLNDDNKGGLELKCPWSSKVMIEFMACDLIKHEYRHQCQFSMWITGRDYWDFANFDPRMVNANKFHYSTIEKCPNAVQVFDDAYGSFIEDMDKILNTIGTEFGQQWAHQLLTNKSA